MYIYRKLEEELKKKRITKSDLGKILSISSRTIAKINKKERIQMVVLKKIANYLDCKPTDLFEYAYDNQILQVLKDEKKAKISGGLYHELQVKLTYNSNHIEGSSLSEDETRLIYETNTLISECVINVNDIIETYNHFRAIDYIIDCAMEPLNEDIIKHIHLLLKQNTVDSSLDWFAIGDYKKRPNVVGGKETIKPDKVKEAMKKLLKEYSLKKNLKIEDIIQFHAEFEKIHPFQDGNGRVGRLIALKECLRFNIVPFIILDKKKAFYYRALSQWDNNQNYLIDTCLDGQDEFKKILKGLDNVISNQF